MPHDTDRTAEARIHTSAKRIRTEKTIREDTNKAIVRSTPVVVLNEEPDIQHLIRTIRGVQVLLDRDMAKLYGVETGL